MKQIFTAISLLFLYFILLSQVKAQNPRLSEAEAPDSTSALIDTIDYYSKIADELDSMLGLWYSKNIPYVTQYYTDKSAPTFDDSVDMDSVYAARLAAIPSLIPLTYNQDVRRYIEMYAVRKKAFFSRVLGLSKIYFPLFEEVSDRLDMPLELKNLAIIESALNPNAVSRAGATGLWQFMLPTGKMYGLDVNTFIDERRDPAKSTVAAAIYLKRLHQIYDDWQLALAAYNCGPGNVNKAIRRAGGTGNFWDIYNFLPRETRGYIPAFIAATYTVHYYNEHSIVPVKPEFDLISTDTVMIHKELHLQQVAVVMDIPIEFLKKLNPQYKRDIIPAKSSCFPLVLPHPHSIRFEEMRDSIHNFNYDTYLSSFKVLNYDDAKGGTTTSVGTAKNNSGKKYHTVQSGESLSIIARKHRTTVNEIKRLNNLKSNLIHKGQRLHVGYFPPAKKEETKPAEPEVKFDSTALDSNAIIQKLDSAKCTAVDSVMQNTTTENSNTRVENKPKTTTHKVEKGDTLWKISQKYGVTVKDLMEHNGLKENENILVGRVLKIPQ